MNYPYPAHYGIMLDLETLGVHNPAILSIGAIAYRWEQGSMTRLKEVSCNVRKDDWMRFGLEADSDTLAWWFKQSEAVRAALWVNPVPLAVAITQVSDLEHLFTDRRLPIRLWANGCDWNWLSNAASKIELQYPWRHRDYRDCRTIFDVIPVGGISVTPTHSNVSPFEYAGIEPTQKAGMKNAETLIAHTSIGDASMQLYKLEQCFRHMEIQ